MINIRQKLMALGIILVILIILNALNCGCLEFPSSDDEKKTPDIDNGNGTPGSASNVIDANNQFGFEYFTKLEETVDNIFFSPFSISFALAMTYEGARGETASEIQTVFHFPQNNNTRRTEFLNIYNATNQENKKYQLSTANALWAEKNYQFLKEYFSLMEDYYGGKVTNLDFRKDPEGCRKIINSWVENRTNDKIKDLIPQGAIDALTRLVITNAIYFKGTWKIEFNKAETEDQDFWISPDNTVNVPMMSMKDKFNYTETDKLQLLEMPYAGDELSMLIVLPKSKDFKTIDNLLTLENLKKWKNNLKETEIPIFIPKFKLETKYFMNENLKDMGMKTPFSGEADFSGMDGTKNLYISDVIHQAFVEVNEEGTEAAAATAVIIREKGGSGSQSSVFRADHPFLFLIQDKTSGNVLFMGKVADPTE